MTQRRAGLISFAVDGVRYEAEGAFTTNLGEPKKEMLVGSDGVHGYKEEPQVPFIDGKLRDSDTFDRRAFVQMKDKTVTLEQANGKVFVLRDAVYAGDGTMDSGDGTMDVRFEGVSADEIG